MDRKRRVLIGVGVGVLLVLVAAVAWFGPLRDRSSADASVDLSAGGPADRAVQSFAQAWVDQKLASVPATSESGSVADRTQEVVKGLGVSAPTRVVVGRLRDVTPEATDGRPDPTPTVEAALEVTWKVSRRTWKYGTSATFVQATPDGADAAPVWQLQWKPSVLHPRLAEGEVLTAVRVGASRGEILGLDGKVMVGKKPVVYVTIDPSATTDRAAAARQVASLVGVDGASLVDRVVNGSGVVSVVTLRKEAYDPISSSLLAIEGVAVSEDEIPLAPTRDYARALIGTVGPATAEEADASDGRVQVGELVGLSGLQASQDAVLGGKPGLSIRATSTQANTEAKVLADFAPVDGKDITITLDPAVQAAADEVMAGAPKPAALVAIRPSTGDVLAVANGPAGANGYNRAMVGRYPPGSTFKVASGLALLEHGLTPDTPVDCPATIVVGRQFQNAEGEVLGTVPFRKDFADSCNTAFIGQSRTITPQQLADAAASVGFRDLDVGAPLRDGTVPTEANETEHAADMIGQGQVEASPFVVALMSASVAAGRTVEPRLVVDPAAPEPTPGKELPAKAVEDLRSLMRSVVTEGTGTAVAGVPGGEVFGKTGTAEFGNEDPPQTHAWFTGYQGDVAFAVLVEDGGFGGQVAAPLAAQFLSKLAAG